MAFKIKNRRHNFSSIRRAARFRIRDFKNEKLSSKEEDARLNKFLQKTDYAYQPGVKPNLTLSSHQYREFLRDNKFFVHLANQELNAIESEINQFVKKTSNDINKLHIDLLRLDGDTREKEIEVYKAYDQVHHNSFTRNQDFHSPDFEQWNVDYKSDLSFEKKQRLNIIEGVGLTLPLLEKIKIPFLKAELIGELTDVGDTPKPILSTSASNVISNDEVFRWIIIKREHDDAGRKYNYVPSYLTLLLTLSGVQLINYIEIVSASSTALGLYQLTYYNEANEEIELVPTEIITSATTSLFFDPIRTNSIKIQFVQKTPVTKLGREDIDLEVFNINQLLEGLGWYKRFDAVSNYIEGRVYDFSIKSITAGLNIFGESGIFISKPVHVDNIASATIKDRVDNIPITGALNTSGLQRNASIVASGIFAEYYLGLDIQDKQGKRLFYDLVPMVDSYPVQFEYLTPIGNRAKLKLMPDLIWHLNKVRIVAVDSITGYRVRITTTTPHALVVDDTISFLGSGSHNLSLATGTVYSIHDDYSFTVGLDILAADLDTVNENTTPYLYLYQTDTESTVSPLSVYQDGIELELGTDYKISFGNSVVSYSRLPTPDKLLDILETARSGKCYIEFTNPNLVSVYTIGYRPYPNQSLGKGKLVKLKNGQLVFDKKFRRSVTKLNTIVILRDSELNPYVTPIVRNYSLCIRKY